MFLYVITNLCNDKQYVGITGNYERRWRYHRTGHGSKIVFNAIRKYGIKNFDFKVICKGLEAYVKGMEILAIKIWDTKAPNGYNISDGGEGTAGVIPSEATRKRMSEAHKGKTLSLEHRKKIGEACRNPSEEIRKKISESSKGRTHSLETRRKISESHIGMCHSKKSRRKISEAHKGKTLSLEHRKKIGKALKGRTRSLETRKKMSETKKGGKHPQAKKLPSTVLGTNA